MGEFRTLDGAPRPPTWRERERAAALRERGIENVYLEPEDAPAEFWRALVIATRHHLASPGSDVWDDWTKEMEYNGAPLLGEIRFDAYEQIVAKGQGEPSQYLGGIHDPVPFVSVAVRLTAIETLLDVLESQDEDFKASVNDRARYYRVGLRLEGRRFVPVTSEHLHKEIVEPTLVLLSEDRFSEVDRLYRKGFDRALSGDASGAITVATSAVEQMLRVLLPEMEGQSLTPLAEKARAEGIIAPAVEEFIRSLYALRPDSDAHAGGTSDFDLAMLALHLGGTVLLYLGKTGR